MDAWVSMMLAWIPVLKWPFKVWAETQCATQAWLMRWWQWCSYCRMTKRGCGGSVGCTWPVLPCLHGVDSQRRVWGGWQEWRGGVRDKVDTVTWEGERVMKRGWRMGQGEKFYLGGCWLVFACMWIKQIMALDEWHHSVIADHSSHSSLSDLLLWFALQFLWAGLFILYSCRSDILSPPPFPHPFLVLFLPVPLTYEWTHVLRCSLTTWQMLTTASKPCSQSSPQNQKY